MTLRRLLAGVLLLALGLPLLSGCDDETLMAPEIQDDLFNSYVSLGDSFTAGVQSDGINSQTQSQSYAVLLAEQMNTPFGVPWLAPPGCGPPWVSFFDEKGLPNPKISEGTENTCGLRSPPPPLRVNNVAVPGAKVIDVLSNEDPDSSPGTFTQLALGGRTQIEAALDANPTFVTMWIGINNVLGAALVGNHDFVTPPGTFESRYTSILDSLMSAESLQGGVLIGVPNVAFFPILSTGPAYFGLDQQGQFPQNFDVASNCNTQEPNTGLAPLVPLEHGFDLIGQALQNPGQTITLDCEAQGEPVLTLNEVSSFAGTVQQYNAIIQQQAQDRGLAYFNPNDVFGALYKNDDDDSDPTNNLIPKFPDRDSDQPFGQFVSLDGFHPSSTTHRVITNRLVKTINEEYGTSLQPIEAPSLPSP